VLYKSLVESEFENAAAKVATYGFQHNVKNEFVNGEDGHVITSYDVSNEKVEHIKG